MVRQFSWLEYMPVTHGVTGSSPVRTAKVNSKLKQSSEIQGFQSFFFFSASVKNSSFRQFSRGLFVGLFESRFINRKTFCINRKTFCDAFPNHFVSILHLLTQNELRFLFIFQNHLSSSQREFKSSSNHSNSYLYINLRENVCIM